MFEQNISDAALLRRLPSTGYAAGRNRSLARLPRRDEGIQNSQEANGGTRLTKCVGGVQAEM